MSYAPHPPLPRFVNDAIDPALLRARACKACKWAKREWWAFWWAPWSSARCANPAVHGWTEHDPVTGTSTIEILMCSTARADDYPRTPPLPHGYNTCGKEGRYFEPRFNDYSQEVR